MKAEHSITVFVTRLIPMGGIESHILEFCTQITNAGVPVNLVVLKSEMLPETAQFYKTICKKVYLGKTGNIIASLLWLFCVAFWLNFSRKTVLYTNGQGSSVLFFSKILFKRTKWIHHHHTSGDVKDQQQWTPDYFRALKIADEVIACSNSNAESITKAVNRPVLSVPCFSRAVHTHDTISRSKLHFGYYGRLIPEKGIDLLCKLSGDVDMADIEFHIWGKGESYPPEYFLNYTQVKYNGSFSGTKELENVLSSIDAYLLLSVHPEGLPIALLEVMSAGLPWLATDQGGIPDIAIDAMSTRLISSSLNYDDVKSSIRELSTDIKSGKVSRIKQKELYETKYSTQILVKNWCTIFGLFN